MNTWPIVKLSDVATFSSGGTPSKGKPDFWNGDIPWISPKDMKSSRITDAADRITRAAILESAAKTVGQNAVLAVVRSGILAHTFPIATVGREVSFNQDIKAITPNSDRLDSNYLFWALKGQEQYVLRSGVKKGATVHSLSNGFLESLQLRLPPLDQQRRITRLLDQAAEIAQLADSARTKARSVIAALFIDTFGDPAANTKQWPIQSFRTFVDSFRYGTNQKCADNQADNALPVLRIPNIVGGNIDWNDLKFAVFSEAETNKLRLHTGDLLFVRTNGNPDYIGRCAEYTSDRQAAYASYLIRARLFKGVSSTFVCQQFTHPAYRPIMLRAGRTTAGNYNLSTEGLEACLLSFRR